MERDPARPSEHLRRDALLEAVAFVGERLLESQRWQHVMPVVLEHLADVTSVSRCYLARNVTPPDGTLVSDQLFDWCAPGVPSLVDEPILKRSPWVGPGFARWVETMGRGEPIYGPVRDFPESEQGELHALGVVSTLAFPVQVGKEWWGTVGFDDCKHEREWQRGEIEALRAVAGMIGSRILRQEIEDELRETHERFRALAEHGTIITYQERLTSRDNVELIYLSPHVREIFGYYPERWMSDSSFWPSLVHPEDRESVLAEDARTIEHGEVFDMEYRMLALGGRVVWVHDLAAPILDENGEILLWQGSMEDITERKAAEQRLRHAESQYRSLVEFSPFATYQLAYPQLPAVRPMYLAPQFEAIFGYPVERWDEAGFWESITYPADLAAVRAEDERTIATREPFDLEYRMIAADGRVVWVHDVSVLLRHEDGSPRCWQGSLLDITKTKEAELALERVETRLRQLAENIPAITYIDEVAPGPTIYVSPQIRDILGYEPSDWFEEDDFWRHRLHPDDEPAIWAEWRKSQDARAPFSAEYRMVHKDGHTVWISEQSVVLPDESGELRLLQGVLMDVTERKHAEDELRRAEAKFRHLVDHLPAAAYTENLSAEPEGFFMSPRIEEITGYSPDAFLAREFWATHIHPEDRQRVQELDAKCNATGDPFRVEYRFIAADGSTVWIRDDAVLVTDTEDSRPVWQGILSDVTELKRAEAELERALSDQREALRRLQEADRLKNTLLRAVSHDIRTPLSAILGLGITLENPEMPLSPEQHRDFAGRIVANARKLDRIVGDMLDLDQLSRGKAEIHARPMDLADIVRGVMSQADAFDEREVELDLSSVSAVVDSAKVERIIDNLLSNTARHTPEGTRVWVRTSLAPEGALLVVEDDGQGVAEEDRKRIFEPFEHGEASTSTGLGLSLVGAFSELHGGRAWVEEREGGGASFRVLFPIDGPASGA